MRALVTGGRGFVGVWLVEHLQACDDEVVVADREVDVTDPKAVAELVADSSPEALYHLAALSHVGQSWADPGEAVRVNTIGTLNVLEAAAKLPAAPKVLLVSSSEVYGAPTSLPVGEGSPLRPVTPYAASKVAAEYMGIQAYLSKGLPVVRVRPFNHIGPGQSSNFVVSALARRIVEAIATGAHEIPIGNLGARRDLTDVRDVVRAYRMLVEQGEPGEVYNVCRGQDVSIAEVAQLLLVGAETSLELKIDPDLVRPIDVPAIRGDGDRIAAATGWRPDIDLKTTLQEVLDWWSKTLVEPHSVPGKRS